MIKLIGYYQLEGSMPVQVDFKDLFTVSFMRKYTKYRSFEKFLLGGGFHIETQQDFEDLPEKNMDVHVARNTKFASWKEMLDAATDIYVRKLR